MNRSLKCLLIVGTLFMLTTPTEAAASMVKFESDPALNGTAKQMTDSKPVKLRLVRDKSEQSRDLAVLRLGVAAIPLVLPLSAPGSKPAEFFCELSTANVHARKSSNSETIGPKPLTKCPKRVAYIAYRTTLEYFRDGRWNPLLPPYFDADDDTSILFTLNIERRCKGFRATQWNSETTSYVVYGDRYYKATIKGKPQRIACGS